MLIEIRDLTLYERLRSLLPRPDAPFDLVFRKLLEQPCKSRDGDLDLFVELLERGAHKALTRLKEQASFN